jgi:hypothetical protein
MCSRTSAAATIVPIRQGSMLMLRSALNVIFSSELPRSPMARMLLWALLNYCCSLINVPALGFLNATVMVSDSPS